MKNFFKFLGSFISSTLLIPITLALTVCLCWYLLPAVRTTDIGLWLIENITEQGIFITTVAGVGCLILFTILTKVFHVIKSSKVNNFCLHILTWLLALVLVAETCYIFFAADTLKAAEFELTLVRKICLGCGMLMMMLYCMLHKKLGKLVDRKIQAYDTAKELNANGRSSVIWVNILKTIDFIFPEFILLLMLCFSFSFEVSLYFIIMMGAFLLPIIGNMICDKRVKKEAIRREEEKIEAQIGATAEAVADLLAKQQGGNP